MSYVPGRHADPRPTKPDAGGVVGADFPPEILRSVRLYCGESDRDRRILLAMLRAATDDRCPSARAVARELGEPRDRVGRLWAGYRKAMELAEREAPLSTRSQSTG